MKAPQIIMIVIISISLVIEMLMNGEVVQRKHSFLGELIGKLLLCGLLWWGGFWG